MLYRTLLVLGIALATPFVVHGRDMRLAPAPEPKHGAPHSDALVATVLGEEILESEIMPPEEFFQELQMEDNEVPDYRALSLSGKIIWSLREQFIAANVPQPTKEELAEARQYLRTNVIWGLSGQTQHELQERLEALESEAADARAKQQQRPALQEEINEVRDFLNESIAAENIAAEMLAGAWKFQRALHRKYGGRASFGDTGPVAIDAMRAWLEEAADRGDFRFEMGADQVAFWSEFPAPGEPIPSEIEDAARIFETLTAYLEARRSAR